MANRLGAFLAAATLLAACNGAGPMVPNRDAVPGASDALRATHASATLSLRIPHRRTRSKFVSPSTKSVAIAQGSKTLGTFDATPSSADCVANGGWTQCAFTVKVTPGKDQVFTVNTYDALAGHGKLLSTGKVVQTIVAGSNVIPVTLQGVVAKIAVTVVDPYAPAGTAATHDVYVMAKDPDGNVIIGPGNYSTPITLTNTDKSGVVKLSATTVSGPYDVMTLAYNGRPITSATIGATAKGVTASNVTAAVFAPVPAIVATFQLPRAGNSTLNPLSITTGPDGNLWFAYGSGIAKMTTNGTMTLFSESYPSGPSSPAGLAPGSDGNVWWAEAASVGKIDPGGTERGWDFGDYGSGLCAGAGQTTGIIPAAASDGGLWVTIQCSSSTGQLAHVTTSGSLTGYDLPAGFAKIDAGRSVLGRDGNVYVAGYDSNNGLAAVAQCVISGSTVTATSLVDVPGTSGSPQQLSSIAQDAYGDLWATNDDGSNSIIVRVHIAQTFSTSAVDTFPTLSGEGDLDDIVALSDGTLWAATDKEYATIERISPAAYPGAPAQFDLPVPNYSYHLTVGADGYLYVTTYAPTHAYASGSIAKVAY